MRPPRVRFTIRRMMVVVAVIALVLGAVAILRRRAHFQRLADYHAETAEGHQMPMMTVFHRKGKAIRHFWSSEMFWTDTDPRQDPRHAGTIEPLWNIFDLTRKGRPSRWQEQLQYE